MIDVVKWQGIGGGIAEVEVFLGEQNIAADKPCRVTNMETVPRHLDDQHSLTDGIRKPRENAVGYWIPEEDTKASLLVDLIGEHFDPQKYR